MYRSNINGILCRMNYLLFIFSLNTKKIKSIMHPYKMQFFKGESLPVSNPESSWLLWCWRLIWCWLCWWSDNCCKDGKKFLQVIKLGVYKVLYSPPWRIDPPLRNWSSLLGKNIKLRGGEGNIMAAGTWKKEKR